MNLYIFPEAASHHNGYGIGVDFAYKKLKPQKDDLVVWYTKEKDIPYLKSNDVVISKNISVFKRVKNVLRGRPSTELDVNDLLFLKGQEFEHIHCDEILFFHALRKLFPKAHMTVRLHNVFSRILERKKLLNLKLDFKFNLVLHLCRKSEVEIMRDGNCRKIFISQEDREYYTSMFGVYGDSEVWPYIPIIAQKPKWVTFDEKLVWFGGVDAHKTSSLVWFIENVFLPIREVNKNIEFHLFGGGTEQFDSHENNIHGHGYFYGDGFPIANALYVNPDIIGGGIKMKLLDLFQEGIPFITTPFGFEGYDKMLVDNKMCYVEEPECWVSKIKSIFGYE